MRIWYPAYFCSSCDKELTDYMIMHNSGVCPLCGIRKEGAVTIVDHYVKSFYKQVINPWWKFWKQRNKRIFLEDLIKICAVRSVAKVFPEREY